MRRDSTTIVALAGQISEGLLARAARSLNISVALAPEPPGAQDSPRTPDGPERPQLSGRPSWEESTAALRSAAGRTSGYVLVRPDPLADVAVAWQAMWQPGAPAAAAQAFEQQAVEVLGAWRAKHFELPDYYLVVTGSGAAGQGPDWYLGPVRTARPRRVALAITAARDAASQGAPVLDALRSLEHGPWWPPLDDLIEGARRFYAGGVIPGAAASGS